MSTKKPTFFTDSYYHIFNRSAKGETIFKCPKDYAVFIQTLRYYQLDKPPAKFSDYKEKPDKYTLNENKLVNIITAELMPTHFHFQLKQNIDDGIRMFIQRTTNSYAHYLNKKNDARGGVFERNFKGVLMQNDEQLLLVSSYIHINAVVASIVAKPEDYPYSTYNYYVNEKSENIFNAEPAIILDQFSSREKYKDYVKDYMESKKELKKELKDHKKLLIDFSDDDYPDVASG